jgi:AraC family transcriptional regulator
MSTNIHHYPAFVDIPVIGPTNTQGAILRNLPIADSRPDLPSEVSQVHPGGMTSTSDTLGWQYLRLIELRHAAGEAYLASSTDHCIVLQFGASLHLSVRRDGINHVGEVPPTQIAIIPAGSSWTWQSKDTQLQTTLLLYLRPHVFGIAAAEEELAHREVNLTPEIGFTDVHIFHIAQSLLHEMQEANVEGRVYADSLAIVLAMHVVRRSSPLKLARIERGGIAPRKLKRAIEFIDHHISEEGGRLALGDLAKEVGMSYFHFSRAFKQSMGSSPTQYIAERRVDRARKLLEETDQPIAEIALRAGFSSQSHFTTTFHKMAGVTPKTFRARI